MIISNRICYRVGLPSTTTTVCGAIIVSRLPGEITCHFALPHGFPAKAMSSPHAMTIIVAISSRLNSPSSNLFSSPKNSLSPGSNLKAHQTLTHFFLYIYLFCRLRRDRRWIETFCYEPYRKNHFIYCDGQSKNHRDCRYRAKAEHM